MSNYINRNLIEVMRDEMIMKEKIINYLNEGPSTIPEIAKRLKCPEYEATYWIMAMWRYGLLEDTGKANAEGYYNYVPKEGDK